MLEVMKRRVAPKCAKSAQIAARRPYLSELGPDRLQAGHGVELASAGPNVADWWRRARSGQGFRARRRQRGPLGRPVVMRSSAGFRSEVPKQVGDDREESEIRFICVASSWRRCGRCCCRSPVTTSEIAPKAVFVEGTPSRGIGHLSSSSLRSRRSSVRAG